MSAVNVTWSALLSSILMAVTAPTCSVAAETPSAAAKKEAAAARFLTFDELVEKRKAIREQLYGPSLKGIRGVSYRVVGYKNYEPLERSFAKKLEATGIPVVSYLKLEEGYSPVDGILQITFYKAGNHTIGDLTLTQWTSLVRDPKIKVRAVTYKNRVELPGDKPQAIVDQLAEGFVADFLKANPKPAKAAK